MNARRSLPRPGSPIRVAALIDTIQVSGPGRQLVALAGCLASAGVEFLVVTFHRAGRPRAPYLDYLERARVRYVLIPERGVWDVRPITRVRGVLARWAPHIVQTHGYKPSAVAYALRRTGATWPWIAFFHGTTSENLKTRFYHWLDRQLMGRADRVVVMSRSHLAGWTKLGGKVRIVYNAVIPVPPAEDRQLPPTLAAVLAGEITHPLIGVVGRLSPEKGVDVFLHACRALAQSGVAFAAVVAGDGVDRRELEALRDSLGLRDRVHFLGTLSALESLYARLDLLVIPSRSEGLPNVLLEALRADVPVVATRVGAIPEVLDSPFAGELVPVGAPGALADAIKRSLTLEERDEATAARRAIADRFSLARRAAAHLELYADVLQRSEPL